MLATAFVNNGSGDKHQQLDLAFDIYDKDDSGSISKSEMTAIIKAIYEMNGQSASNAAAKVADVFARFDSDGSKSLSKAEFITFILNDDVARSAFSF